MQISDVKFIGLREAQNCTATWNQLRINKSVCHEIGRQSEV